MTVQGGIYKRLMHMGVPMVEYPRGYFTMGC